MLRMFFRGRRAESGINNQKQGKGKGTGLPDWLGGGSTIELLESRCMLSAASASPYVRPLTPSDVAAAAVSANRIDLAWRDNSRNETGFLVYVRPADGGRFAVAGRVATNVRQYSVTGLTAHTDYLFRVRAINRAGSSGFTTAVGGTTTANPDAAPPPTQPPTPPVDVPVVYSGPITITRGGVYSGNWQSLNANVAAVTVRTSEPVVIQNANIKSRGTLIDASGRVNITVQNTRGYGLNPNIRGRYAGRFLDVNGFVNVTVQNCYMEGTSGIYLYGYGGDGTAGQSVHILRNQAKNIDGRYSNGNGGFLTRPDDNYYVQFFQTNNVHNVVGAEVGWNQVINEPGKSRVEDNISIFDASGTKNSPFVIHDNYIQGAYPANAAGDGSYTGGGIMVSDVGSAYIQAYNNQVISTTNYGIAISSGHDNAFFNNRIVSAGMTADGTRLKSQNVGAYIWNMNNEAGFVRNIGYNNVIGWAQGNGRNDYWVPDASGWSGNASMGGSITLATEAAEWTLWSNKLAGAGVTVGPA